MRIAFTSCLSAVIRKKQPTWACIQSLSPKHLVLLGDCIYTDAPVISETHPEAMRQSDEPFTSLMFDLYRRQVTQIDFARLIKSLGPGHAWSIWDDHDFLWNDACGAFESKNPYHKGKIPISTSFHEAFRQALASGDPPNNFPAALGTAPSPAKHPLATPSIQLEPGLWLHLSDGRTFRTKTRLVADHKRTLLGAAQRKAIGQVIADHPNDVHLFASGSTLSDYKKSYPVDWAWLCDLASRSRVLVLSGDVHRNQTSWHPTQGLPLHEATSSGAAIRSAVSLGTPLNHYGILDIDTQHVTARFFDGQTEQTDLKLTINRSSWTR